MTDERRAWMGEKGEARDDSIEATHKLRCECPRYKNMRYRTRVDQSNRIVQVLHDKVDES